MITPPYYAMINAKEVIAHYRDVSDHARVPILLYNLPRRTGVNLTPELCERLAEVEYVVAIKESNNDLAQLETTLTRVGDRILVFSGGTAYRGMAAALIGCPGIVGSTEPHILGREGISLFDLAVSGRIEEARRIQLRALSIDKALHTVGTAPASLKAAMNMVGRPGGYVRKPLLNLDKAELDLVAQILSDHGFSAVDRNAA
jgi:dihydrodipicolinate synthase/N-acetylneuraminate lyase